MFKGIELKGPIHAACIDVFLTRAQARPVSGKQP